MPIEPARRSANQTGATFGAPAGRSTRQSTPGGAAADPGAGAIAATWRAARPDAAGIAGPRPARATYALPRDRCRRGAGGCAARRSSRHIRHAEADNVSLVFRNDLLNA